jgi:hypothetical protein
MQVLEPYLYISMPRIPDVTQAVIRQSLVGHGLWVGRQFQFLSRAGICNFLLCHEQF